MKNDVEDACGVRLQACRVEIRLHMSDRRHDCRRGTPGGARHKKRMPVMKSCFVARASACSVGFSRGVPPGPPA
jgi:hypothetical protein